MQENENLPAMNRSMHCQGGVRMPHNIEGRKLRGIRIRTLRMVCCLVVWSVHNTLEIPGIKGKIGTFEKEYYARPKHLRSQIWESTKTTAFS
jgi:hypothetical protein